MKKIGLLFIAMICLFCACNDDFLDRSPGTNISDAKYWKSPNDLKLYANNFYNKSDLLPQYSGSGNGKIGPFGTDGENGTDTQVRNSYNTMMNGERLLASASGWGYSDWELLRNANYFMDHYANVTGSSTEINRYVGEVLFFRSLFYFIKLKKFGDVPYVSTTLGVDSEALFNARDPRDQVVDSLMRDLDLAVEYLPVRGSWTGRLTKEVAMMLQAQIALFEGTWEKYHAGTEFGVQGSDGSKFLQKAATVSKQLMDLGTCELDNVGVPNGYTKLFNQENYSSSREVIFWRKYSVSDKQFTTWGRYTGTGSGSGATKALIDYYLCADGKPISVSSSYQGDATLKTVTANRDPRLAQTICVDDGRATWTNTGGADVLFVYPGFDAADEVRSVTGYQLYKGHNTNYSQYQMAQSVTGAIYYRFAEALLIYAEAKAELGTITQADIDLTINRLRERVGMTGLLTLNNITPDPQWSFPTLSPIINEVRRERTVELACEGFRLDDLFRWAAADELVVGKKPKGAKKAQWDNVPVQAIAEKLLQVKTDAQGYIEPFPEALKDGYNFDITRDYLYPIPLTQLSVNPKIKQNPGWD